MGPWSFEDVKEIIRKSRGEILKRCDISELLISALDTESVVAVPVLDKLKVQFDPPQKKVGLILDGIQTAKQFVAFCLVLAQRDIGQQHVVTEVMGLTIEEVQNQLSMLDVITAPAAGMASHPTTTARRAASSLHLWDPENPSQQTPISLDSSWKKILTQNRVKIAGLLNLTDDIWEELKSASVIDEADSDRIKLNKTPKDQIYKLLDYLLRRPVWCFHALLRAAANNGKTEVITNIGLNANDYVGP